MCFISPNKHLLKAGASTRSIVVYTLNFSEQNLAGLDPMYEILDVPVDCGFYIENMYMCLT